MSQGKFQFDLWKECNPDLDLSTKLTCGLDWEGLRKKIIKHGLRNSLLTTIMPTASTSQILNNSECIEPLTSNMFSRRVLSGEFIVLNKYMVKDLKALNLWKPETKDLLLYYNGSIQNIPGVPDHFKSVYKTVWEISQKSLINQASDRGLFIDQSQSLNLFVESPTHSKLTSMHFYAWNKGLKTGIYYLRSKSSSGGNQITVNKKTITGIMDGIEESQGIACPYIPGQAPDSCEACSS